MTKSKVLLIMMLCVSLGGCLKEGKEKKGVDTEAVVQQVDVNQSSRLEETLTVSEEKKLFKQEDLELDGHPILLMNYAGIKEQVGEPLDIEVYRRYQAASDEYDSITIAIYDDFELRFTSLMENEGMILDEQTPTSFDIFGDEVSLDCGLHVGMTVEEVREKFGDYEVGLYQQEENSVYAVKGMLAQFREPSYYDEYSEAMQLTHDFSYDMEKDETISAMGIVLLIKDNVVEHIILGYPGLG